jgi:hypothetical protein
MIPGGELLLRQLECLNLWKGQGETNLVPSIVGHPTLKVGGKKTFTSQVPKSGIGTQKLLQFVVHRYFPLLATFLAKSDH